MKGKVEGRTGKNRRTRIIRGTDNKLYKGSPDDVSDPKLNFFVGDEVNFQPQNSPEGLRALRITAVTSRATTGASRPRSSGERNREPQQQLSINIAFGEAEGNELPITIRAVRGNQGVAGVVLSIHADGNKVTGDPNVQRTTDGSGYADFSFALKPGVTRCAIDVQVNNTFTNSRTWVKPKPEPKAKAKSAPPKKAKHLVVTDLGEGDGYRLFKILTLTGNQQNDEAVSGEFEVSSPRDLKMCDSEADFEQAEAFRVKPWATNSLGERFLLIGLEESGTAKVHFHLRASNQIQTFEVSKGSEKKAERSDSLHFEVKTEKHEDFMSFNVKIKEGKKPSRQRITINSVHKSQLSVREEGMTLWDQGRKLEYNCNREITLQVRIAELAAGKAGEEVFFGIVDDDKVVSDEFYISGVFLITAPSPTGQVAVN